MARRLLDTSILLSHWNRVRGDLSEKSADDARDWARELIKLRRGVAIATPVVLEVLGGVRSSHELSLTLAYLGEFKVIDGGKIPKEDWDAAQRIAARVPPDGRRRDLGDCLIRAIANRLHHEVDTPDGGFPRK
jgi:predicted nucleic acid-binding protein